MARKDWIPLPGGFGNEVARRGDRVRRRTGPGSPAVHDLLRWLEARGFSRVPRLLEVGAEFEVLTYLEGTPVFRPWPEEVKADGWMRHLGTWVREYHTAVQGFEPRPGHSFAWGPAWPGPGMVVNHGDLGPWNVIRREGRVAGAIDWDLARWGDPLDDLAQLALEAVPLRPSTEDRLGTSPGLPRLLRRLRALCAGYGNVDGERVLTHTVAYLERTAGETEHLGRAGQEPFAGFLGRGFADGYRAEARHIRAVFLS